MTRVLLTTVWVRLTIALLVAGWTVTVAVWQHEDASGGETVEGEAAGYWPCGEIRHLARSTYRASDIEVVGNGCGETRDFVRRVHEVCQIESCEKGRFECEVDADRNASCQRGAADVRWTWTPGGRTI